MAGSPPFNRDDPFFLARHVRRAHRRFRSATMAALTMFSDANHLSGRACVTQEFWIHQSVDKTIPADWRHWSREA